MENIFKVQFGSIYKDGCIIENPAFVINKETSVLRYGDSSNGMNEYYTSTVKKYRECGLEDMANDLFYIEFDKYESHLTTEEICTFANYIVLCSCNGLDIYNMLLLTPEQLKAKIRHLAEIGY